MDIGTEKPAIVVEPIEDPFRTTPEPAREAPAAPREPAPVPEEVPA